MNTVQKFEVDRSILKRGIYISSIDDDITIYDIRMREPNGETVLTNSAIHTIEHIFKAFVKKSEFSENIIIFAPMGSRTGFTLVTRRLTDSYSLQLIKDAFQYIADFWGMIPEITPNECSNCLEHSLPQAKEEAKNFLEVINDLTKDDLKYPAE